MNFGQAIKMAFKSLGSKKLRTFLTMLGVIIGVTCVALLTTVTSGAKDYIVGTLKEESQVVNMMMLGQTKTLTKSDFESVSAGIDKGITGNFISSSMSQGSAYAKVNSNFLVVPASTHDGALYKKDRVIATSVVATDTNYDDVRNVDLVGRFFEEGETDKCTINQAFIEAYYPKGTKAKNLLGTSIELFAEANITRVMVELPTTATADLVENAFLTLANTQLFGTDLLGTEEQNGAIVLQANWFEKYSGLYLMENSGVWSLVFELDNFHFTNEGLAQIIQGGLLSSPNAEVKQLATKVSVQDKSATTSKTFEIVGVVVEESSVFNSMADSSFITQPELVEILERTSKGSVNMLLCDDNMKFLTYGTKTLQTDGDKSAATLTPSVFGETTYPTHQKAPISSAFFRFENEKNVEAGASQIMSAMVAKGFMPDSFIVVSMNTIAGMVSSIMNIMTIMLSVIAGISLVVGGIGIMNIMLVTVSERTREIGIRKAIGAKRSSILLQFLIEALVVTIMGGLIGIVLSLIGTLIIGHVMGISMMMPLWVFALSLGFSIFIGVVFGMYPAVKASRMHPIDALRHD